MGGLPMRLTALLPHLKGFRVDQTIIEDHVLTLLVRPTRRTAVCPRCHRRSGRVHGRYYRTLAVMWTDVKLCS